MNLKKRIDFYTNLVKEGWSAKSLDSGVGGSEEKLIELARELAKEYEVTVYHNGEHGVFDGVNYRDHLEFKGFMTRDTFVSFKTKDMFLKSIAARKRIHWTTEIEGEWKPYELDRVNSVLTLSNYHNSRMATKNEKIQPLYLWADLERLERNKVDKEMGTMLYCSSYDRGLEELLSNWGAIKEKLKLNKLYITYGWDFIDKIISFNPSMADWKKKIMALTKQDGIIMLGRLDNDEMCKMYWKSQYWCLPLNNPDSELFCINAVKAQYCEAIPVVRRVGALQETVNEFIDFDSLLGQKVGMSTLNKDSIVNNKKHASRFSLDNAVKEWKKIIE
jgi:hypothetical protein